MPRVQPQKQSLGVRVHGYLRDFQGKPMSGKPIKVSLPFPCSWEGVILPVQQAIATDELGHFELLLPPTSELVPLSEQGTPAYFLVCEGIGSWYQDVPVGAEEVLIGAPRVEEPPHGGKK